MSSLLLLILGIVSLLATFVSLVRVRHPAVLSFFVMMTGWLTGEYPLFHVVSQLVVVAVLVGLGGLDDTLGQIGVALFVLSWLGLLLVWIVARRARSSANVALRAGLGDDYVERLSTQQRALLRTRPERGLVLRPLHFDRTGIVINRNISYGDHPKRNLLDVYRPDHIDDPLPVVVQVHGGGWVIGNKVQQGQPLLHRLARNDYVCVSINYRLAPKFRFPDQLVDVKRALAWVREYIDDYGGDPSSLLLTGGSAGGHLSSLAALTPNQAEYQPGFESVDTSVSACIPFYPPTDFDDRQGFRGRLASYEQFLRVTVMPGSTKEYPDLYAAMSPIEHVNADAPPFLIIQGHLDVLVWREETRVFAETLREVSCQPVVYWEVPGAQHAFDTFNSWRSAAAIDVVERFVGWVTAPVGASPPEPS